MPSQKRQLAAIMFTDIVGYTTLMGEDEVVVFICHFLITKQSNHFVCLS